MLASVIIPYYYKKDALLCTLDTLNKQTYKDFEVVVVNDGSDDILDVIKEKNYSIDINYRYYPRIARSGRSYARNKGIQDAKGEILIFLDCDQAVNETFVENHMKVMTTPGNENRLQYGTRRFLADYFDDNYKSLDEIMYIRDNRLDVIGKENFKYINQFAPWHFVYSHNMSIRKERVVKYGGFGENFRGWGLEDTEFAFRMYKNGIIPLFNDTVETYSQFDMSKIDENKKFSDWKFNFEEIIKIHSEPEIYFQSIFDDYYSVEQRKKFRKLGVADVGLFCYIRFNEMLRILNEEKDIIINHDNPRYEQYISDEEVIEQYKKITAR